MRAVDVEELIRRQTDLLASIDETLGRIEEHLAAQRPLSLQGHLSVEALADKAKRRTVRVRRTR